MRYRNIQAAAEKALQPVALPRQCAEMDLVRLVTIAAVGGASFMFMRVLAPAIGPILSLELRLLIASLILLAYYKVIQLDVEWRRFWKPYLAIGLLNSVVPLGLYSLAALHLPASYLVILHSSAPLFASIFGALWLHETMTPRTWLGLVSGAIGVALTTGATPVPLEGVVVWSIAAGFGGAMSFALAGLYMRQFARGINPMAIAGTSQLLAALVLLPAVPLSGPRLAFDPSIAFHVLGLAVLCSTFAHVMYFRLMARLGPTRTLTITFIMPAFGMLWGRLFLGETVSVSMVIGCTIIVVGTALVMITRSPTPSTSPHG